MERTKVKLHRGSLIVGRRSRRVAVNAYLRGETNRSISKTPQRWQQDTRQRMQYAELSNLSTTREVFSWEITSIEVGGTAIHYGPRFATRWRGSKWSPSGFRRWTLRPKKKVDPQSVRIDSNPFWASGWTRISFLTFVARSSKDDPLVIDDFSSNEMARYKLFKSCKVVYNWRCGLDSVLVISDGLKCIYLRTCQ